MNVVGNTFPSYVILTKSPLEKTYNVFLHYFMFLTCNHKKNWTKFLNISENMNTVMKVCCISVNFNVCTKILFMSICKYIK